MRPCDVRIASDSEYSTEFVGRLAGYVDSLGRLRTGGAVAVVLPKVAHVSGVGLDEPGMVEPAADEGHVHVGAGGTELGARRRHVLAVLLTAGI